MGGGSPCHYTPVSPVGVSTEKPNINQGIDPGFFCAWRESRDLMITRLLFERLSL